MESHGINGVDLDSLASRIEERLRNAPQHYRKNCIYRVPKLMRQINEEAYTPLLVSIGPLHHGDERLVPMENQKLKYLNFFLSNPNANEDLLRNCLEFIRDKETELRECYADPTVHIPSDVFIQMVLVDSAFIIEFFRRMSSPQQLDSVYDMQLLLEIVIRDINLEENQLPFFILNQLYCVAFQTNAYAPHTINCDVPSFTDIACMCLCGQNYHTRNINETHYFHLLHLIACHSRTDQEYGGQVNVRRRHSSDKDGNFGLGLDLPPATQLHAAGVKFQVIKGASSMFDIMFNHKKGILMMPKLQLNDDTECICRNLIAFEQGQCGINDTRYFTDYYSFLNCLINTDEDVELLADAGIIHNLMGSHQQASDLINSLSTHASTSIGGHYYMDISFKLKKHCENEWNRYKATLMHTYFNHPWAAISVVYAIVLLLLTIAQLVVGIIAL